MLLKKLKMIFILALFGLGLAACGGDDSDMGSDSTAVSAPADAPMAMSADGTLPDYDPDVPSMVVEDNGVIHQEEIYKAWPQ